jgi:hypothetical protein
MESIYQGPKAGFDMSTPHLVRKLCPHDREHPWLLFLQVGLDRPGIEKEYKYIMP